YISLGQRLQGKTFYKNIFRLPPASVLSVDRSGSVSLIRYYEPEYEHHADTKEQLQIIEDTLLHALSIRIQRSGIAFGLSGGLDSRITLAALKKLGMTDHVTALTHGLADSHDMTIAARLAKRYRMPHRQIIFDDDFFTELPHRWREVTKLSEGGLGIESAYALASWHRQSKQFGISMESHGGPLFRRQILKAREGTLERANNFPDALFGYVSSALLSSDIIKDDIAAHARAAGRNAMEEYFSSFSADLKAGDKIDRFYLEQMCANKYALSANAQIHFLGLSHPLLSLKAYNAATKITENERKSNGIYKYLLNRFAPELKYFQVDNSGYSVPYLGYRMLRYAPPLYEKIVQKLPKSFHKLSLRRPAIVHRMVAQKNFEALQELLLEPNGKSDHFFIRSNLEKALSDFQSGRKDNFAVLIQAANLRLLLELFA
ncbi:MAG: asparagine synthase-related protein, partial [Candidatus Kapaibacterium sp.]